MVLDFRINDKEPGVVSWGWVTRSQVKKPSHQSPDEKKDAGHYPTFGFGFGFTKCQNIREKLDAHLASLDALDPLVQEVRTTGYCEWELHPSVPSDLGTIEHPKTAPGFRELWVSEPKV